MNLDQASLLRELMNKNHQIKTNPIAFISTSNYENSEKVIMTLSEAFALKTQRKIVLFGISNKEGKELEQELLNGNDFEDSVERISPKILRVSGGLDFTDLLRVDKALAEKFINCVHDAEKSSDTLMFYAGNGLHTTTINYSLMAPKVIMMLTHTDESLIELNNYVKIFAKTRSNEGLGILVDTENPIGFQEQLNKLQELYWKEFKYYIEPIGFFNSKNTSLDLETQVDGFNYEYLTKKVDVKLLSESIKEIFM